MKNYAPIILIALSVGIYFLYLSPAYSNVQALRAEKARSDLVLQTAKDIVVKRDAILTQYKSISQDNLDRLKVVVPEKFKSISALAYVNNIAVRYGMPIKDISINDAPDTSSGQSGMPQVAVSPYKISTITFSVMGSYPQFVQLLQDIQSSLYLFEVTSLTIKSNANTTGNSQSKNLPSDLSTYTIEFNTYSLN